MYKARFSRADRKQAAMLFFLYRQGKPRLAEQVIKFGFHGLLHSSSRWEGLKADCPSCANSSQTRQTKKAMRQIDVGVFTGTDWLVGWYYRLSKFMFITGEQTKGCGWQAKHTRGRELAHFSKARVIPERERFGSPPK